MWVSCSYKDKNNKIVIKTENIKTALDIERQLLSQYPQDIIFNVRHSKEKPRFKDHRTRQTEKRNEIIVQDPKELDYIISF